MLESVSCRVGLSVEKFAADVCVLCQVRERSSSSESVDGEFQASVRRESSSGRVIGGQGVGGDRRNGKNGHACFLSDLGNFTTTSLLETGVFVQRLAFDCYLDLNQAVKITTPPLEWRRGESNPGPEALP